MASVQNSNDGHVFPRSYAANSRQVDSASVRIGSPHVSLTASDVTSITNSTCGKRSGDFHFHASVERIPSGARIADVATRSGCVYSSSAWHTGADKWLGIVAGSWIQHRKYHSIILWMT